MRCHNLTWSNDCHVSFGVRYNISWSLTLHIPVWSHILIKSCGKDNFCDKWHICRRQSCPIFPHICYHYLHYLWLLLQLNIPIIARIYPSLTWRLVTSSYPGLATLWLWWAGAGLFVAQHRTAGVYSNTRRPGLNLETLKGIMCSLGLIGKLFIQQNLTFQVIFNLKYCYRRLRLRIRAWKYELKDIILKI